MQEIPDSNVTALIEKDDVVPGGPEDAEMLVLGGGGSDNDVDDNCTVFDLSRQSSKRKPPRLFHLFPYLPPSYS